MVFGELIISINEFIRYESGLLLWKKKPCNAAIIDRSIGYVDGGYLVFRFRGFNHKVHRVVWMIHNGEIPDGYEIDHINHDKLDNRIENLRCVTKIDNGRNQPKHRHNTSGFTGVGWMRNCKKWRAEIRINNKTMYLGSFDDIEMAKKARREAEIKFGFHDNHGR